MRKSEISHDEVDRIRALLVHEDPSHQQQGGYLAKALGDWSVVFNGTQLDERGRLETFCRQDQINSTILELIFSVTPDERPINGPEGFGASWLDTPSSPWAKTAPTGSLDILISLWESFELDIDDTTDVFHPLRNREGYSRWANKSLGTVKEIKTEYESRQGLFEGINGTTLKSVTLDLSCTAVINVDGLLHLSSSDEPYSYKGLAGVDLYGCKSLRNVDGLANLRWLQTINLAGCVSIESLDGIANLSHLYRLNLTDAKHLETLDGLTSGNLPNLEDLVLDGCTALRNVDGLAKLPLLKTLDLAGCTALRNVDGLANLPLLKTLDLAGCTALKCADGLGRFWRTATRNEFRQQARNSPGVWRDGKKIAGCDQPLLENISLRRCENLSDFNFLAALGSVQVDERFALKKLSLAGCPQLQSVESLSQLTALTHLDLSFCIGLESVIGLADLNKLRHLDLCNCRSLEDIDTLASLSALESLDLSGCYRLTNVDVLGKLENLTDLKLEGCTELTDISALKANPNLDYEALLVQIETPTNYLNRLLD